MRMRFNTVLCVAVAVLLNLEGSFCQLDVCGQAPLNTKMTERATATAGSWPWQVNIHLISTGIHYCSGSLINKDWVLTSVQCTLNVYTFNDVELTDMIINLGRESYQGPNPHEVNRTVIQIIKHPNYIQNNNNNDIALLQLSSPVSFNDYIRPVCLAAAGSVFNEGLSSWVTGWAGSYNGDYSTTDDLLETEVPVVSNPNCYNIWKFTTDNMLCAGILIYTGNSRCAGDFGGPLVIKQGSQWIQSGITSFTNSAVCDFDPTYIKPIVFTRVSQYQEWINTQIASDQPGFVEFYQSIPDPIPFIPDPTPPYIPDPTPAYIPDPDDCIPDIFSGSSLSLHSYPVSLTFSIISLIFCLFMKVV